MRITKLQAENFKRLTAVTITPDGSVVTIAGRNGAGKSSTLDAIEAALGGLKHAPKEPIRQGSKKARVVVETEDLVVTRSFTAKGSQLEVKSKDGGKVASPQGLLDSLVGPVSFDPLDFVRKAPKEQAETLRELVGLDFTAEDAKRKEAFEKRTEVNREAKRLQGAIDKLPEVPDGTPDDEVWVAELTAEIERRQAINAKQDHEREELERLRQRAIETKGEIERLEEDLATARALLEDLNYSGKALSEKVKTHKWADVDEVRAQIAKAEETNRAARAKAQRTELEAELATAAAESERLTEYIAQIDTVKAEAIAGAKYPIEGLAVTDDGVTLDGVPFEQASQAQRLRASIAIGLALNPKLKVLLVRDGSLLDPDGLKAVAEMAEANGAQVWLEKVGDGDGCSIVIEDGAVAESAKEGAA